ncbi:GntR family transcriptional regulator [Gracilibacillus alcaliphilus]|uniref:GntR family transcriptional regulator n=1 Tax=Gracilibacillus alcaliphilus TaxID=1401441 RepID=UPI00195CD277|nr:GntR family transcriptional regulator [Gracilibacillus alcaliphilus]MBM7678236.1 GntR family transcriptional regulator [Gracilibacillus alcaliphilus]
MEIIISNRSKEPIYEQITKQIQANILSGDLAEGQALPSIRKLAKDLQVSVITTKRAYEELEKAGFIYSIVGKGSFVAEQNLEVIREKKLQAIEEQLGSVISNSKEIGLPLDELQQLLKILYEDEDNG